MVSHTPPVHRIIAPKNMEIHLTDVEKNICDLLQDCITFLLHEKGLPTTCRIAGGWVRDKVDLNCHLLPVTLFNIFG